MRVGLGGVIMGDEVMLMTDVVWYRTLDPVKKVSEGSVEEWRKAFDVNVFSAVGLVSHIDSLLPSLHLLLVHASLLFPYLLLYYFGCSSSASYAP